MSDIWFEHSVDFKSRTLYIGDNIDADSAERYIKGLSALLSRSASQPITVLLNCSGGEWEPGMAIYDMTKACPCEVTIIVLGQAQSMGSIILQAADHRIAYPHSLILIHNGTESSGGDMNAVDLERLAENSARVRSQMYRIYASSSHKPVSFWRNQCKHDQYYTAEQALDLGLIDEIYD